MPKIPLALGIDEWEVWESETRTKHPVWFFFHWSAPNWFRRLWGRLRDAKWWVLYRFHPRHRYNVVHTGLPPGYYDEDDRILWSAFACFEHFYQYWEWAGDPEKHATEHVEGLPWESDEDRNAEYKRRFDFAAAVEKLHAYWTERKADPWKECEQEDEMLQLLVSIRGGLWN